MKSASIVIAAYNEEKYIGNCLKSIFELDYDKDLVEVIVVDNNSKDRTLEIAQKFSIKVLKEKKKGPSWARNTGIAIAKNEIIVFIDADVVVTKYWLKNLIAPFQDAKICAVGGKILPMKENYISNYLGHSILGRYQKYNYRRFEKSCITCNLAIRKELLKKGFDTNLKIYGEDLDITMHLVKQGYKLLYDPTAVLYHAHPESIVQLLSYWIKSAKGRVYFCKKYPSQKTCILMKYQIFSFYLIFLILSTVFISKWFLLSLIPLLTFLYKIAVTEYHTDKRIILNFFIAPALNLISIFFVSLLYGYYKYIDRNNIE